MNDYAKKVLMRRITDGRNSGYSDNSSDNSSYDMRKDMNDLRRDMMDFRKDMNDLRRGMSDGYDGTNDMKSNSHDVNDYHMPLRLTKADMHEWKKRLINTDGSEGEHFNMSQVMQAAEKLNVRFNSFSEKEFCLAVNVIYSDFGEDIRKFVGPEKELLMCASMAISFLDDPDGPEPSSKLARYYHFVVRHEDEI